jgi:hypothetical protein
VCQNFACKLIFSFSRTGARLGAVDPVQLIEKTGTTFWKTGALQGAVNPVREETTGASYRCC